VGRVAALEAALADAEARLRAQARLLDAVTHEARTPLAGIVGLSRLVRSGLLAKDAEAAGLEIERSARVLLARIDDVDVLTAPREGADAPEVRAFSPAAALARATPRWRARAAQRGLRFDLQLHGVDLVEGDPRRFARAVAALVDNALKFTRRGAVCVRVERDTDGALVVRVVDTGPGLDAAQRARLLAPTAALDAPGVGLGLAVVTRLCASLGGALEVDSAPGRGATFLLRLPMPALAEVVPLAPEARGADDALEDDGLDGLVPDVPTPDLPARAPLAPEERAQLARAERAFPSRPPVPVRGKPEESGDVPEIVEVHADDAAPPASAPGAVVAVASGAAGAAVARPSAGPPRAHRLTHPPTAANADSPGRAILVVEDNAVNQKIVVRLLEQLGYRCTLADNGRLAVDLVQARAFDAILMDLQMPVMDGFEATREIRRLGHAALPIVALTANVQDEFRDEALAAGMNAFLTKPVQRRTLDETLSRLVAPTPTRGIA
jgi:CheY-like chemotaxis protein/anti-sigma regulatory factor (Ser/Thr protein kinase)